MISTAPRQPRSSLRKLLGVVPGVGVGLLPAGLCPACWPAYGGVLSSLGLGFLLRDSYLLALTAALFVVALVTLGYRAPSRRGYGPFGLGVVASGVALTGKFALSSDYLLYLGLGLLVAASLWNAWPRPVVSGSCAKCAVLEPELEEPGAQHAESL